MPWGRRGRVEGGSRRRSTDEAAALDARRLARPLRSSADLDPLLDRIGDARYVLLGEASHGTSEFYAWRAAVTRRLVREKGFAFVAVEGDWPDCYRVSCSVTASPGAPESPVDVLRAFDRWPTWMWANEDVASFLRWLRQENLRRPDDERVGFYGLDVYSLWDSLRAVVAYLQEHHPGEVETALRAFRCFEPYAEDPQEYAHATRLVPTSCEEQVLGLLHGLRRDAARGGGAPRDARFDAQQNARAVAGAEAYYRELVAGGPEAWNLRDRHMADTLDALVKHHGGGKAVVWEHNTHVGDARWTDMVGAGMVSLGQLVRERHDDDGVVLVGFGSHRGTVVAADSWGAPPRAMRLPPARVGSVEDLLHERVGGPAAVLVWQRPPEEGWLAAERPHRAVGVVYDSARERWGNYVPTVLGRRYDAFVWVDETRGLTPLHGDG